MLWKILPLFIVIIFISYWWEDISFIYNIITNNYMILIISSIIVGILIVTTKHKEYDWVHGTAKWATKGEIITEFGQPIDKPLESGSFYLGYDAKKDLHLAIPPDKAVQHGLIIGPPGTGKSRGYFLPNARFVKGTSYVITDPKGELWELTSGYKEEAIRYAPGFEDSAVFNWVPLCKDADIAQLCARAMVTSSPSNNTDPFWINAETAFLTALFSHFAYSETPTPVAAYEFFTLNPWESVLEALENSPSIIARQQKNILVGGTEDIKGGIVPGVANLLQFLQDPKIARFTSSSLDAPDFGRLKEKAISVYYCMHEQDIKRLQPLSTVFYTIVLEQLTRANPTKGNIPVLLLLDEFANIGKLPDFDTTITVTRGRGIGIWMGIQNMSQLEKYEKHNAEVIMGVVGTRIALHSMDNKSAEYISKSLGDTTIVIEKETISDGGGVLRRQSQSKSYSSQEIKRPLITPSEVNLIGKDEAIVKVLNYKPMRIKKIFYDEPPKSNVTKKLGEVIRDIDRSSLPNAKENDSLYPPSLSQSLLDLEKELF